MRNTLMLFLSCFMLINPIFVKATEKTNSLNDTYAIPEELIQYFEEAGKEKNICPELLEAIAFYESRFIPDLENENCVGIMQIDIKIHKSRMERFGYSKKDMLDPEKNIIIAADILYDIYQMYGDDNPFVIMYYSGQKKALTEYKKSGKISNHARDVLILSEKYERYHDK